MIYQIFKKLLLVYLCLCLLSSFVFAADYEVGGVSFFGDGIIGLSSSDDCSEYFISCLSVSPSLFSDSSSNVPFSIGASFSYKEVIGGNVKHGALNAVDSVGSSSDGTVLAGSDFRYEQLYFYPSNAGSATVTLSPVPSDSSFAFMNPNLGTVSYSISGDIATVTINMTDEQFRVYQSLADPSSQTVVALTVSGSGSSLTRANLSLGYSSFEAAPDKPFVPPTNDMQGLHGYRDASASASRWKTYNQYIGIWETVLSITYQGETGPALSGESDADSISADVLASLGYNGYSWKVDNEQIVFMSGAAGGSWLDMIFRYSTYDYFWGSRLWSNDVSGSWFGAISDNFSYLNFRVNQILDVLANDEDLAIKDATTAEREWVKDYFSGSGDKADSDKYDKLNNTGSAFKDVFAGAPDSSIADGFTAINDNGYVFWSQGVSDDINGNNASSFGASRAPAYVPPEQRIVDAYSENWAQIVGGYYD
jgi:hypothetical protein